MAKAKPHINIVFVGHVDHGKSTTVGRLIYDSGNLPEQELKKLRDKAQELGKVGFEFAFVMDNLKEERERGVTIDLSHKKFVTNKFEYTIIDAPGHRDFIKNMITGASQADVGVLVVAASDGVMEQTKEHVFLCRTLGVNQLCVLINKMDAINYDKAKFEKVKADVTVLLKAVGYKPDKVTFLAISAFKGDNIVKTNDILKIIKTSFRIMNVFSKFKRKDKGTNKPARQETIKTTPKQTKNTKTK